MIDISSDQSSYLSSRDYRIFTPPGGAGLVERHLSHHYKSPSSPFTFIQQKDMKYKNIAEVFSDKLTNNL